MKKPIDWKEGKDEHAGQLLADAGTYQIVPFFRLYINLQEGEARSDFSTLDGAKEFAQMVHDEDQKYRKLQKKDKKKKK